MRILCVCTGNTCRSPMLEVLLADALRRAGVEATVESAGTAAAPGEPASDGAQRAMAGRGLDLAGHRSRGLDGIDLGVFNRIFTVSSRHAAHLRSRGVEAARIAVVAAERGGVPDPFGGGEAEYEAAAATLAAEAARIAAELSARR